MIPLSTVKLLRAWAQWGETQSISYPSMSPMFGERALKAPLFGVGHIPDGVWEMERAVCNLTYEDRDIIIQRWQRHRTYAQIALRLGCSRWTIGRRIKGAEAEVHRLLEDVYACVAAHWGVNTVIESKTDT
jgi:Sigma-70, region 4